MSEYVHSVVQERAKLRDAVHAYAAAAFAALKKTAKRGPHRHVPQIEELEALTAPAESRVTAIVFFLDETFEELHYDASTTLAEAAELIAGQINLRNHETFRIFECYKYRDAGKASILSNGQTVNEFRTPD